MPAPSKRRRGKHLHFTCRGRHGLQTRARTARKEGRACHVSKRRIHSDLSILHPARGSGALLDYLENKSDFFTAPASARYHSAYEGGLCEHSLNVYDCLKDYLERTRVAELYGQRYSEETIALVALLHDVCKVGCYKPGTRNVKGEDGRWQQVPTYFYEDPLPYGHGEKSVYIINGFLRLSREEAMAIRWHMGFSGDEDKRLIGRALAQYPWPSPSPRRTWRRATSWRMRTRAAEPPRRCCRCSRAEQSAPAREEAQNTTQIESEERFC